MSREPILLDSITDVTGEGGIVVSGSHGGMFPAAIASKWQLNAVVFNDAGIGLERAGVAGVMELENIGMAAAAADSESCCIGLAIDMLNRGRIKIANSIAVNLGVSSGMLISDAVTYLTNAVKPTTKLPMVSEVRKEIQLTGIKDPIHLLDSASMIRPEDNGKIVITGSHGGLVGGDPTRALKAKAKLAVFNDAGVGLDNAGITRLSVLEKLGISAVTVGSDTARIGDALSSLETGRISHANKIARDMGAKKNDHLKSWLKTFKDR